MADTSVPVVSQVTNQNFFQSLIDSLQQGSCLLFLPPPEAETANEEKYEGNMYCNNTDIQQHEQTAFKSNTLQEAIRVVFSSLPSTRESLERELMETSILLLTRLGGQVVLTFSHSRTCLPGCG